MTDAAGLGARLRALRARMNMKQDTAAAELGVSQAYISRLECGAVKPAPGLAERIERLLETPQFRPHFDRWRETVRHCEGFASLIRMEQGAVRADCFSAGFLRLGGVFPTIRTGQPLDGLFARSTDDLFAILVAEGLFEGAVVRTENLWRSGEAQDAACFRVVNIPVRDDLGQWFVHTSHQPVPPAAFLAWQRGNDRPHIVRSFG